MSDRFTIQHADGRRYKLRSREAFERIYAPQGFTVVGEDVPSEPEQPVTSGDAPQPADLEAMYLDDLRKLASERGIPGRSAMSKAELVAALSEDDG